ncbi:MAG: hypothetical protein FWC97_08890 [Treponema sp.]|nr:hypothetical protein [Treponema sp.]
MKKFISVFLISILFLFGCKSRNNININQYQDGIGYYQEKIFKQELYAISTIDDIDLISTTETIFRVTLFDEQPTYPIYIEGRPPYLIFSNNSRVNIWQDHLGMFNLRNIRNIRIFSMPNKESESMIIDRLHYAALLRVPETEDWLYLFRYGFIYVYDFPSNESRLEYELLQRFPKFRRYGPLLKIHHNNRIIRLWDSGNENNFKGIELVAYYEEHEEILIRQIGGGDSVFRIYNLRLESFTNYIGNFPRFNSSRDLVISANDEQRNQARVKIFMINNGVYTEVFNERINANSIERMYWVNNDEFKMELWEEGNILIRRKGTSFEIIYINKN